MDNVDLSHPDVEDQPGTEVVSKSRWLSAFTMGGLVGCALLVMLYLWLK